MVGGWEMEEGTEGGDGGLTAARRARCPPRHMPVLPILPVHVGRLRR